MKKTFFFAISLLASALLLTNFTSDSVSSFIMTVVTEEPNLPDTPFDYERINFPDHLSAEQDTIETGYTGRIDTIRLQSITDDLATLVFRLLRISHSVRA